MRSIRAEDHYFAEINWRTSEGNSINHSIKGVAPGTWPRNNTERVVKYVYEEEFGVHVGEVDLKRTNCMDYALAEMPEHPRKCLQNLLLTHLDLDSAIEDRPITIIEKEGIPDLFIYDEETRQYRFLEVKTDEDSIRNTQRQWFSDFKFIPVSVVISFTDKSDRRKFLNRFSTLGLDELIGGR